MEINFLWRYLINSYYVDNKPNVFCSPEEYFNFEKKRRIQSKICYRKLSSVSQTKTQREVLDAFYQQKNSYSFNGILFQGFSETFSN